MRRLVQDRLVVAAPSEATASQANPVDVGMEAHCLRVENDPHDLLLSGTNATLAPGTPLNELPPNPTNPTRYQPHQIYHNTTMHVAQHQLRQILQSLNAALEGIFQNVDAPDVF